MSKKISYIYIFITVILVVVLYFNSDHLFYSIREVQILDIKILEKCDNYYIIEVKTKQDLGEFDNSNSAYKINLLYNVDYDIIRENMKDKNGNLIEEFPYYAERTDKFPFDVKTFITNWKLAIESNFDNGIYHTNYNLDDNKEHKLVFIIHGNRLKKGYIESNRFFLNFP